MPSADRDSRTSVEVAEFAKKMADNSQDLHKENAFGEDRRSTAFVNRDNEVKFSGLVGNFPSWMIDNLKKLDIDGTGTLSKDDMAQLCCDVRKLKVNQISNCAEIDYSVFPKAAQDVFKSWDKDESGSVTVTELMLAAKAQKQLQNENLNAKRALAALLVIVVVLISAMFATNEWSKDVEPVTSRGTTEMRTKVDGQLVETGSVSAYSTLADLPKQSRRFLENLESVSYLVNGGIKTARITSHTWRSPTSMDIAFPGSEAIEIEGDSVTLVNVQNGARFPIVSSDVGGNGRRLLSAAVGSEGVLVFTRSQLDSVAMKLEATGQSGAGLRHLTQDQRSHLVFGAFVSSKVSSTEELQAAAKKTASSSTDLKCINLGSFSSAWTASPDGKFASKLPVTWARDEQKDELWYLKYDQKDQSTMIQIRNRFEEHSSFVTEIFNNQLYKYQLLHGTMTDDNKILEAGMLEQFNEAREGQKVGCTSESLPVPLNMRGNAFNSHSLSCPAELVSSTDAHAVWDIGGFHIRADMEGTPKEVVDHKDSSKVLATIGAVIDTPAGEANGMFTGCSEPASTRRLQEPTLDSATAEQISHEGRHRGTLDTMNTLWCGAETAVAETQCPGECEKDEASGFFTPNVMKPFVKKSGCPLAADSTVAKDRACRRHDYSAIAIKCDWKACKLAEAAARKKFDKWSGSSSKKIAGTAIIRTSCQADYDLYSALPNDAIIQHIYSPGGLARFYGCWDTMSHVSVMASVDPATWKVVLEEGIAQDSIFVRSGTNRYLGNAQFGYMNPHRMCEGDLWSYTDIQDGATADGNPLASGWGYIQR